MTGTFHILFQHFNYQFGTLQTNLVGEKLAESVLLIMSGLWSSPPTLHLVLLTTELKVAS